ncbi:MAG: hypothetical protein NVSMB55_04180 [Mycobacteriales bacterium]
MSVLGVPTSAVARVQPEAAPATAPAPLPTAPQTPPRTGLDSATAGLGLMLLLAGALTRRKKKAPGSPAPRRRAVDVRRPGAATSQLRAARALAPEVLTCYKARVIRASDFGNGVGPANRLVLPAGRSPSRRGTGPHRTGLASDVVLDLR